MRRSIEATHDSAETGPRFHVTTRIGDSTLCFQEPIPDPFVRTTVRVGWRDALRLLWRHGHVPVTVLVGGTSAAVEDVMELDAQYLGRHDSTRRAGWNARVEGALTVLAETPPQDQGGA